MTSPATLIGPGAMGGPAAGGPCPPLLPPPPPPPSLLPLPLEPLPGPGGPPGGLCHSVFQRLFHISSGEGWFDVELDEVATGAELPWVGA